MLSVVTWGNGSMIAVAGSKISNMSLDSMDFHPRMDEPSKPRPASKTSSSNSEIGAQKCCQVPRKSQNLTSTSCTFLLLHNARTSLGVIPSSSPNDDSRIAKAEFDSSLIQF